MSHQFIDPETQFLESDRDVERVRRRQIFDAWDGCCAYCGSHLGVTLDHVVPRAKGGDMGLHNLIPSCPSCNGDKGCEPLSSWYPRQEFYSPERMLRIQVWRSEPWAGGADPSI